MKKQGRKIWLTITLALIMLISSFACLSLPEMNNKQTVTVEDCAFAENDIVSYSLLPADFYKDEQMQEKYNLKTANVDIFTPFDFDLGKRMDGRAFRLEEGANQQIINQYVTLQNQPAIAKNDNLALMFWIYVNGRDLHNLSIELELENGTKLTYSLSKSDLADLLAKPGDYSEDPYAFNRISLPIKDAVADGNIYNGDIMYAPTKMTINYTSLIPEEQNERVFANLYFFDVKMEVAKSGQLQFIEKQDYYISSFNHISSEVASKICVGDTYKIPILKNVVNYAYKGREDLLDTHNPYTWRVRVVVPDKDMTIRTYFFGENLDFELEGIYKIYYECVHAEEGTVIDLYSRQLISVNSFNPIYFEKKSMVMHVGKTYILNIQVSKLFTETSEISFDFNSDALDVSTDEGGNVLVSVKKTGTYNLTAKVSGKRALSPEMKEYEYVLKVVAKKAENTSDTVYRIFLYVALALIGLTILISIVILLVKSRKFVVK